MPEIVLVVSTEEAAGVCMLVTDALMQQVYSVLMAHGTYSQEDLALIAAGTSFVGKVNEALGLEPTETRRLAEMLERLRKTQGHA